jgi:hypothetical protein
MAKSQQQPIHLSKEEMSELLASGRLRERAPRETDIPLLTEALNRLAVGKPAFLKPEPFAKATPKNCWLNVKPFIEANGGESCPGWHIICHCDLYYLKCIPHVVVKQGEKLMDVTPPEFGERVLFLADRRVTVETRGRIIGLSRKPKARRVIACAAKFAAFEEAKLRKHNDSLVPEYLNHTYEDLPFDVGILKERGLLGDID